MGELPAFWARCLCCQQRRRVGRPPPKNAAVAADFAARVLVACVDLHLTRPIHKRARRCHQKEPRRRFENPFGGDRRDLDNMAGKAILD
jgi:hypothetical protein